MEIKIDYLPLVEELRHSVNPETIVNEWLIDGMKVIGDLLEVGKCNYHLYFKVLKL